MRPAWIVVVLVAIAARSAGACPIPTEPGASPPLALLVLLGTAVVGICALVVVCRRHNLSTAREPVSLLVAETITRLAIRHHAIVAALGIASFAGLLTLALDAPAIVIAFITAYQLARLRRARTIAAKLDLAGVYAERSTTGLFVVDACGSSYLPASRRMFSVAIRDAVPRSIQL